MAVDGAKVRVALNVGSLFTGIGGIDLGLERAGMRVLWQCEADEWRREVLRERFPGVACYADVRDVGVWEPCWIGRRGDEQLARERRSGRLWSAPERNAGTPVRTDSGDSCDLLCGGFPCQDLSVAGRRAGFAGERSSLFFEFARVADLVRPEWLLLENVPGLLSSNGGRDFGELLGTLADLGYGVAWRVLDSRFFGVPQRRRRVFILAHVSGGRAGAERCGQILSVGSRCDGHFAASGEAGPATPVASLSGLGTGGPDDNDAQQGRIVGTLPKRVLAWGADEAGAGLMNYLANGTAVRRLTPREYERLQGFPDDWTALGPDSRRYAALGDAVTVPVAEWIGRRLMAA